MLSRKTSTCFTCQENENLRSRVQQLELSLQQRAEQLSQLERRSEQTEWRRGEELRKREDRVRELQLELDRERGKEPAVKVNHHESCFSSAVEAHLIILPVRGVCQYVTQTVEVESAVTVKQLTKARQRNEVLSERLANQNHRCKQLEEQIRKSDEHSCNLQHKVSSSNTM